MAESKLRVNLIGDASSLNRSLSIASQRLDKFGKKASQIGKDLSLRLSLPIALAGGAAIKMAASMEESLNKVRVSFGESSTEVEAFAKTALKSFGIAESSALDMTALFGDMATGMGVSRSEAAKLSTDLVGLAGDLASFKDINISEVTTALSGVFTGETESLKRLGIVMTEVNLEQFRLNEGINKSVREMTQQEKIMLRLRYIFSVTKNAQGDFARTSESASNQMRTFQQSLKELAAELGNILLPAFTDAITKLNELLEDFRNLDKETQKTIVQIGLLAAAIPPLVFVLGQLAEGFAAVYRSLVLLTGAKGFKILTTSMTKFFAAFTAAVAIYQTAINKFTNLNISFFEGIDLVLTGITNRTAYINKLFNKLPKQGQTPFAALDEDANKASKSLDGLSKKFATLPFGKGRGSGVSKVTPDDGDQASKNMLLAAERQAEAIDKMLKGDGSLTYALAVESAAVENFGNKISDVAEEVRTPFENMTEYIKGLTEESVRFLMQVGQSLQSAFMSMLDGENIFKALARELKNLIKRLIATAMAAAVVSSIIAAITGGNFGKTYGQVFSGLSGFGGGGMASPQGMGNIGMGGAGIYGNSVNVSGQFRLDGQDLVVSLERATTERNNLLG